jgi:hypothetical protein
MNKSTLGLILFALCTGISCSNQQPINTVKAKMEKTKSPVGANGVNSAMTQKCQNTEENQKRPEKLSKTAG